MIEGRAASRQAVERFENADPDGLAAAIVDELDRDGHSGSGRSCGCGVVAGPWITVPSAAKREPWHGQSHVRSEKDYANNWQSECHEQFCALDTAGWYALCEAAGFTVDPASRGIRNDWLVEHRFSPCRPHRGT